MMPNGIAQMAMSHRLPSGVPLLVQRTDVSHRPTTIPARMHSA